jgi:hypothetical protein
MTIEEIRKNAPNGSTHYHPNEPIYIKFGKKYDMYVWWLGEWVRPKSKIKKGLLNGIKPLY